MFSNFNTQRYLVLKRSMKITCATHVTYVELLRNKDKVKNILREHAEKKCVQV